MNWKPIDTLPEEMRDGRQVWVRRVHEGRVISEGFAVFGLPHEDAPMRRPLGPDPLNRLSAADYAAERQAREAMVARGRWLNPDRMYAFPEPTEWRDDA